MKAAPFWSEARKRWQYNPMIDGKRKSFYSSKPGPAGLAECRRKEKAYLESGTKKNRRLRDAWPEYMKDVAARGGTDSVKQRNTYGLKYFTPAVGHKLVGRITDQDWQDIINAAAIAGVSGKSLSKKSLRNMRGAATDFSAWAIRSRLIDKKPVLYIPRSKTKQHRIIQPDDLHKLFDEQDNWYINGWRLMVLTGMRPGELYGLQRQDVDTGYIHIRRAVNIHREVTEGKNENARRVIKLPKIGQEIIDKQISLLNAAGIASGWLFPARNGQCTRQGSARGAWLKFAATAGISCTPYELRHTFISIMKNKMPLGILKRQVGHSASMNTLGTYGHDLDGELDDAANIIDATLTSLFDISQSISADTVKVLQFPERPKTGT